MKRGREEEDEEEEEKNEDDDDENEEEEEEPEEEDVNPITSKHVDTIKDIFKEAHTLRNSGNPDRVLFEVEARLGEQVGRKFRPGISRSEFYNLKEYFDMQVDRFSSYKEEEIDYIFQTPGDQKGAYRVNFTGEKPTEGQLKTPIKKFLLRFNDDTDEKNKMGHDVRIGLAQEMDYPPNDKLTKNSWKMMRKKERWTYEQDERVLKVDLTIVTTSYPRRTHVQGDQTENDIGNIIYEAEFELMPDKFDEFTKDPETLAACAEIFYSTIYSALTVLKTGGVENIEASPSPFSEVPMKAVKGSLLNTLKTNFAVALRLPSCSDFPGSMPVTFGRRHVNIVQSGDYMVSEKTDGYRYMLLICPSGAFLVDRKFFFFEIDNVDGLKVLFSVDKSISLFDGELIRHQGDQNIVFLLFDVIQLNGNHVGDQPLKERLKNIGQIVSQYRTNQATMEFPFSLCGKNFFQKQEIAGIFGHIHSDPDGARRYVDKTRNHKTDGIIFTPSGPYGLHTCTNLFKWKFLDKQTIDFRAKRVTTTSTTTTTTTTLTTTTTTPTDSYKFELYVGVKGGESRAFLATFPPDDLVKMAEEFDAHGKKDDAIIECGYDRLTGMWKYHTIRPDKKKPNFVHVAFDTLTAIAEAITKDEIIARCTGHHQGSHPPSGNPGQPSKSNNSSNGNSSNNRPTSNAPVVAHRSSSSKGNAPQRPPNS